MSQIDWSKAPEGATHFHPKMNGYTAHWIKDGFFCRQGHEHGGWLIDSNPQPSSNLLTCPIEWIGGGMPPIGCLVEDRSEVGAPVYIAEVVAVEDGLIAIKRPGSLKVVDLRGIRPVRTPKQIAADQYEQDAKEIAKILSDLDGDDNIFVAKTLLDCGYRKFEIVDE